MQISVKTVTGKVHIIETLLETTIGEFKALLQDEYGYLASAQRLIFSGSQLDDTRTLSQCGVEAETSIFLVVGPARACSQIQGSSLASAPVSSSIKNKEDIHSTDKCNSTTNKNKSTTNHRECKTNNFSALNEVKLNIKTLVGEMISLSVPKDMPFGEIKYKFEDAAKYPAFQMRLIYAGSIIDDEKSPQNYNCEADTCIHLVRKVNAEFLDARITSTFLRAHCKFCHTEGVPLKIRYRCRECSSEALMLTTESIEIGKSIFRDILNLKCECFSCGGHEHSVNVGFMCDARLTVEDKPCPSSVADSRSMLHEYRGGGEYQLTAILNQIYGYPHGGGFQVKI